MNSYVAVVGLGYVGLPLAVSMARAGMQVLGVDTDPAVRHAVDRREPPFAEPGLAAALRAVPTDRLTTAEALPERPPAAVILCVGTPVAPDAHQPDLRQLRAAVDGIAPRIAEDTLVVVRSTVPVGTCRRYVLPALRRGVAAPLLACCPERTIQGLAMAELGSLPQIVGGLDSRSRARADQLFAAVCPDRVPVSSLEAAEMTKLACNAHTDLIYGFGNELALTAAALGLDAWEIIDAANLRYPRPDISGPGYVGGSCLTKDPYLLLDSAGRAGRWMPMVAAARAVNESVPYAVVDGFRAALARHGDRPATEAKVLVCGMAYKGRPATDDVRGGAAAVVATLLGPTVGTLAGHDFLVPEDRTKELGYEPVDLDEGLCDADGVILLNDHPGYRELEPEAVRSRMRAGRVVFDVWGVARQRLDGAPGVRYLRYGRG
ncbi:nucleotide sugar dehydrogenase [Plantactinospora sp. KLBMP9567]|uniref:nucleotide sugar dehydrogenase n=1 Tax=Plantactinospora sp. KLBMP9567 TaxID=3085900 RepID=UPI002982A6FE|nr:nucleotide sugar dehydrogenase [Plantactinospora sp. KLBMP9567]MDW5329542.1 nucleotide sugar dehydrogenase [Plantactinospora sp. KLBMP9567]